MANAEYIPAFNYDFLTPLYDFILEVLGYGYSQRIKVVKLLDLNDDEYLLDLGSGTGSFLLVAKKKHPKTKMAGIDIDPKVLELARKKFQKERVDVELIEASANKLPFKDKTFDVVVSSLIFHHLPTEVKKEVLKEVYRVLKPNGRFLLVDFGKDDGTIFKLWNILSHLLNVPEAKTLEDNANGLIPGFMEEAGFKVKEIATRYRSIQYLLGTK